MKTKNILIEIHHGLGDVIQIIPLINNIQYNFPKAKISVILASEAHASILKLGCNIHKFYFFSLKKMNLFDILGFILKIRKEKYDIGIVSPISNEKLGPFFMRILGCSDIICLTNIKYFINNKRYKTLDRDKMEHRITQNLRLLKGLDADIHVNIPQIDLTENLKVWLKKEEKNFDYEKATIGICIGTNPSIYKNLFIKKEMDTKKWALENYFNLINKIKEKYNVLLLGGKKEYEESAEKLYVIKHKNIKNYINKTTVEQSIALMSCCELVIGGDTGMIHAADALGIKTLVLYGPTDPLKVGPLSNNSTPITLNLPCQYCWGTKKMFECTDRRCLNSISVEFVDKCIQDLLHRG